MCLDYREWKEKNFLLLDPNNCNLIFIADSFEKMQSIFKMFFTGICFVRIESVVEVILSCWLWSAGRGYLIWWLLTSWCWINNFFYYLASINGSGISERILVKNWKNPERICDLSTIILNKGHLDMVSESIIYIVKTDSSSI